jgi:hypothetical protein
LQRGVQRTMIPLPLTELPAIAPIFVLTKISGVYVRMPSSKTPVFYLETLHLVCERRPSEPLSGICHREYLSGFAPD